MFCKIFWYWLLGLTCSQNPSGEIILVISEVQKQLVSQIQLQSEPKMPLSDTLHYDVMQKEILSQQVKTEELQKRLLVFTLLATAVIVLLFLVQLAARQRLVIQLRRQHKEIEEKNYLLEEQKEEITTQATQLEDSNQKIQQINKSLNLTMTELEKRNGDLQTFNENLDALVKIKVEELKIKDVQLSEYAFYNAHKLRSPLASILGIVWLLKQEERYRDSELVMHLELASKRLDEIVHEIQVILQEKADDA